MLLDYRIKEHIPLMNRYKKVKGINLINTYLPHLNPLDKMYVIDSEEDWNKIENEFPLDKTTARCDSLIGVNGKLPDGQTFHRDRVRDYIKEVRSASPDGVVILQQMKPGYNERIHTQGGVNIDVVIGDAIRLEYVGPSFDCRELCKGKASHEAWYVPWDEVPFLEESSSGKYKIGETSHKGYVDSAKERCAFLLAAYPDKKDEIFTSMPPRYKGIKRQILRDIIEQVIFPLYDKREMLARNGLRHFGVELNVIEDGTLVPLELAVGDRFSEIETNKKTLFSKLVEERE